MRFKSVYGWKVNCNLNKKEKNGIGFCINMEWEFNWKFLKSWDKKYFEFGLYC